MKEGGDTCGTGHSSGNQMLLSAYHSCQRVTGCGHIWIVYDAHFHRVVDGHVCFIFAISDWHLREEPMCVSKTFQVSTIGDAPSVVDTDADAVRGAVVVPDAAPQAAFAGDAVARSSPLIAPTRPIRLNLFTDASLV